MNAADRLDRLSIPEPNSGCWIWTGSTDVSGYGRIAFRGRNWKASRVAWLLTNGDPGHLHVLHRCDNRLCVNPDHLFLGTNRDNSIDKAKKGRHHSALLSPEQVREIRKHRASGVTVRRISETLGLRIHLVFDVIYHGTYSHVS